MADGAESKEAQMKVTLTDGRVVEGTVDEIRQILGVAAPTTRRRPRRVIPPHNCDDTGIGCGVCVGEGEYHALKLEDDT